MTCLDHSKSPARNSPQSAARIPPRSWQRFPRAMSPRSLDAGRQSTSISRDAIFYLRGAIVSYEQSATQTVRQPTLTATGGGPLAARVRTGHQPVEDNLRNKPKAEELVEPVVYVVAKPENAPHLFEGEPCFVRFEGARWVSVWSVIIQRIRDFWDRASDRMSPLDSTLRRVCKSLIRWEHL